MRSGGGVGKARVIVSLGSVISLLQFRVEFHLLNVSEDSLEVRLFDVEELPTGSGGGRCPSHNANTVLHGVERGTVGIAVSSPTGNRVLHETRIFNDEVVFVLRINQITLLSLLGGGDVLSDALCSTDVASCIDVLNEVGTGSFGVLRHFPDIFGVCCRDGFGQLPSGVVGPAELRAVVVGGVQFGAGTAEVVVTVLHLHSTILSGADGGFQSVDGSVSHFVGHAFCVGDGECVGISIQHLIVESLADLTGFVTDIVEIVKAFGRNNLVQHIADVGAGRHFFHAIYIPHVLIVVVSQRRIAAESSVEKERGVGAGGRFKGLVGATENHADTALRIGSAKRGTSPRFHFTGLSVHLFRGVGDGIFDDKSPGTRLGVSVGDDAGFVFQIESGGNLLQNPNDFSILLIAVIDKFKEVLIGDDVGLGDSFHKVRGRVGSHVESTALKHIAHAFFNVTGFKSPSVGQGTSGNHIALFSLRCANASHKHNSQQEQVVGLSHVSVDLRLMIKG